MSVAAVALLAFDTSTERLAVAVQSAMAELHADEAGGAQSSARLLPAIEELLSRAGLVLGGLDAIAFGSGPGAFTGLRTSCAVAQGLAMGLSLPVLRIDSLLIVAEDARLQAPAEAADRVVDVVMDARMGEAYAARYRWTQGRWAVLSPPVLCAPRDWLEHSTPQADGWLAGSGLTAFADLPWDRLAPPQRQLPQEDSRPQALMSLARAAWAAGEGVDASLALPTYLRDKVALTTLERQAAAS